MKTAKLNRTIRFKFGKALRKGLLVEIAQTNENTCLVRRASEPTLEYLVSKDALDIVPKMKLDKRNAKKLGKIMDEITYRILPPNDQRDLHFKDEGDMLTVCFMTNKAIQALVNDPNYKQWKERIYGDVIRKTDIMIESKRNMIAWAVSHGLTISEN